MGADVCSREGCRLGAHVNARANPCVRPTAPDTSKHSASPIPVARRSLPPARSARRRSAATAPCAWYSVATQQCLSLEKVRPDAMHNLEPPPEAPALAHSSPVRSANRSKQPRAALEIALVLGLFLTINVLSSAYQHPTTDNAGRGHDGAFYYKVADDFRLRVIPEVEAPFVYRIGVPFLVSRLFPESLFYGFNVV